MDINAENFASTTNLIKFVDGRGYTSNFFWRHTADFEDPIENFAMVYLTIKIDQGRCKDVRVIPLW